MSNPGSEIQKVDGEIVVHSEMGGEALAAREEAKVRVRAGLARSFPRDWEVVSKALMAEVTRPGFAEKAYYSLPRKKKDPVTGKMVEVSIEELSVRFAETAARIARNVDVAACVLSDTSDKRLIEVEVMDLEANYTERVQMVLSKTEERRGFKNKNTNQVEPPSNAGEVLGRRKNSYGDELFICRVPEDQMMLKQNNVMAKLRRNKILAMIPADIKDACLAQAKVVKQAAAEKELREDSEGMRRKMFAAFSKLNVSQLELTSYVQARWRLPIERLQAPQMNELRALRTALEEGHETWVQALSEVVEENEAVDPRVGVIKAPEVAAGEGPKQPPTGTTEFADWLRWYLASEKTTAAQLRALGKQIHDAPKEQQAELTALYLQHPNRSEK